MARLGIESVRRIPGASRPLVLPDSLQPGIVHLGVGAFHRAHQAVYTEAAIAASDRPDWGIIGVAPRRPEIVDALKAQDYLFSVTSLSTDTVHSRVVGSVCDVLHAPGDPARVVGALAGPTTRVVTLTVTEKAYLLDRVTGKLVASDSLRAELDERQPPTSMPGLVVAGLRARARADAGPVTLVSCDNLPSNGDLLRHSIRDAVRLTGDDSLGAWVESNVSFPRTMVDRIVPATTPDLLRNVANTLGVTDDAAVQAEPYSQWVIEDSFLAGRPEWEDVGAVITKDPTQYEDLKLRTVNGVHSTLAYLGALAGCRTIADALALPGMRNLLERFIADDVAPSLTPPNGVDVVSYGQTVLERFANPAIEHLTTQVATDGSQKLPQRVVHTIMDRRANGGTAHWATLAVAAWMRFVQGTADDGGTLPLSDPLADDIRAATLNTSDATSALLGLEAVFPAEVASDDEVWREVSDWYQALAKHGARAVVAGASR